MTYPVLTIDPIIGVSSRFVVEEHFIGVHRPLGWMSYSDSNASLLTNYVPDGWHLSQAGSGQFNMGPGYAEMFTYNDGVGNTRLRYGEDGAGSAAILDRRNFNVGKHAICEALFSANADTDLGLTIGFVGPTDPQNVCALIFTTSVAHTPGTWKLQCIKNGSAATHDSGYTHAASAGGQTYVRIEASPTQVAYFINDDVTPRGVITDTNCIPTDGFCFEFQVYNLQTTAPGPNNWKQATFWPRWVRLQGER